MLCSLNGQKENRSPRYFKEGLHTFFSMTKNETSEDRSTKGYLVSEGIKTS